MVKKIIKNNKEWIFSGAGVAVIVFFLSLFFHNNRGSVQTQSGRHNNQAGRDIIIYNGPGIEEYEKHLKKIERILTSKPSLPKLSEEQLILEKEIKAEKVLQKFRDELPAAKIDKALVSLRKGVDTRIVEDAFDDVIRKSSGPVALAAYHSGQLAENRIDYFKAMNQFRLAVSLEKNNIDYLFAAGQMARKMAYYEQSQIWLERLNKILETEQKDKEFSYALHELADLYKAQGKYEQAEPLYQRSLAIKEKALGKDHPSVATTLNNLAGLYKAQGKYEQAEPLYQRSLAILESTFPEGHPNIDVVRSNYVFLKLRMED